MECANCGHDLANENEICTFCEKELAAPCELSYKSRSDRVFALQAASVVLFVASLCLPAIKYHGETDYGFVLLLLGWMGLLANYYPWLANPLYAVTLALTHRRPRLAVFSGMLSLVFAISPLIFRQVPGDSGHHIIDQFEIGFYLWTLSLLSAVMAAGITWAGGNDR